jgi:hypothetical protein
MNRLCRSSLATEGATRPAPKRRAMNPRMRARPGRAGIDAHRRRGQPVAPQLGVPSLRRGHGGVQLRQAGVARIRGHGTVDELAVHLGLEVRVPAGAIGRGGHIDRFADARASSVQLPRRVSCAGDRRSQAQLQWSETQSPGSTPSSRPSGPLPAVRQLGPLRPELQAAVHQVEAASGDEELLADDVDHSAPADATGIHRLDDRVRATTAHQADAREDLEDVEGVHRPRASGQRRLQPAPVADRHPTAEALHEVAVHGAGADGGGERAAQPVRVDDALVERIGEVVLLRDELEVGIGALEPAGQLP